jgi:hypothetical protein
MAKRIRVTKVSGGLFAALVLVAATAVGAFAFMIGGSSSTFTANSPTAIVTSPGNTTLTVTVSPGPVTNVSTGIADTAWQGGDAEQFDATLTNPSNNPVVVHSVWITGWTSNAPGCSSAVGSGPIAGTFSFPSDNTGSLTSSNNASLPLTVPANGQVAFPMVANGSTYSIFYNNLPAVDQGACAGASGLTFTFASN